MSKETEIKRRVYLDHAAATPMDLRVKEAMDSYMTDEYGNAGGLYREGRRAKDGIDHARKSLARILSCRPDEVVFTSGGTEGDVLAIIGTARANKDRGSHIVTTTIEHQAVLESCEALEKEGFEVTYVDVEPNGVVDPKKIESALRDDTILVSVMYANNEIGTIQPIRNIAKILKDRKIIFHTDACQASEYLDLDVQKLGVDLLVLNGSKVYGPKGVGAVFVRNGTRVRPILFGGAQEGKRRAGTENVPGIVGLGRALEIADEMKVREGARLSELRDYLISRITKEIKRTILNGDAKERLPNNVNISILDIEGEATLLYLDNYGIACSTGSACTSESLDPSHVILALGKPYEHAHASIRFTLGRGTKKEDLDYLMEYLPGVVTTLRKISPITVEEDAKGMSHPEAFAGENMRVKANSKNYK
ncbi:MAG: cysteine desulfurase family protein [bacterium]|nr:cysteine desulfurase family protein [bacterium]